MKTPHVLIVLDGFGLSEEVEGNAVKAAHTPEFDRLFSRYPNTAIEAHGTAVGLMPGLMGNSEVGHMNIGAGRVVAQDIDRINNAIADGSFFENPALCQAVDAARRAGTRLHLMGLLSDGGVHSSDAHYAALLELCARRGLAGDRVVFHAFLDGRDTPPKSAHRYLDALSTAMQRTGAGVIGTVIGRYWAMDRDRRWERVQLAYDALVHGKCAVEDGDKAGLDRAYAGDETDEFVKPFAIRGAARIGRRDAVIFFNFRADRARQMTEALTQRSFDGFPVLRDLDLTFVTMTEYKAGYGLPVGFTKTSLVQVFTDVAVSNGLTQLRIAETEKYAHVTFFFNGGREEPSVGEDRILVPSPKVAPYDLQPEMCAPELTEHVMSSIAEGRHDVIILNFANPDMVGHSGVFSAAIKAVEAVDRCVGVIAAATLSRGGALLLTADHGNVEQMFDPSTGQPHTAHTTNPVPVLLAADRVRGRRLRSAGRLADVVPTFLDMLGIEPPRDMTGQTLLEP